MSKIPIELMDLFTGETRVLQWELNDEPGDDDGEDVCGLEWSWEEGNWSCDCNRIPEWNRCGAAIPPELKCGEPRIRARCKVHGVNIDDFPANEQTRVAMAAELRTARAEKRQPRFEALISKDAALQEGKL